MNNLDHLSVPPQVYPIQDIIIPEVINYQTDQQIPVYEIRKDGCGVIYVEMTFRAGRPQEHKYMVAACCAAMLLEGAGDRSSAQIAEEIDYLGASLSTRAGLDYITVKGVCLQKHFDSLCAIIGEVLSRPHFSEEEFRLFVNRSKERLKIQTSKPDIISYRAVTEAIYGAEHPYGYNSSEELYQAVTSDDLRQHQMDYLTANNCQIFIAGDITDNQRDAVNALCRQIPRKGKHGEEAQIPTMDTLPERKIIPGGHSQSSIRIGRRAFTRQDPDFDGLNYVCNILGGYFGSRLSMKIREDKGLTYSIYSTLDSQVYAGDMIISTDVSKENTQLVIDEIFREMEALQSQLIKDEEIALVNNYMMGNYLNLFDGPFNSIRAIKSLALANIPLDELDTLIKSSIAFDAPKVQAMAQKYFDRQDFWEVIVGTL